MKLLDQLDRFKGPRPRDTINNLIDRVQKIKENDELEAENTRQERKNKALKAEESRLLGNLDTIRDVALTRIKAVETTSLESITGEGNAVENSLISLTDVAAERLKTQGDTAITCMNQISAEVQNNINMTTEKISFIDAQINSSIKRFEAEAANYGKIMRESGKLQTDIQLASFFLLAKKIQ